MPNQESKLRAQLNKKNERNLESVNRPEQVKPFAAIMDLAVATFGANSEFSSATQTIQLQEKSLQTAQQQSLVQGIGRTYGNSSLQRFLAIPNGKKNISKKLNNAIQRQPDSSDQTPNDDLGDPISFPVHHQVYALAIEFPATASLGLEVKVEFGYSLADPTKAKGKAGPFKGDLGELKRSLKISKDGIKNQLSVTVAKGEVEIGRLFDSLTVSIGGKLQIPVDIEDLMKMGVASVIIFQAKGDGTELLNKLGRQLPAGIQATIKVEVIKKINPKDLAKLKAMGKLAKEAAKDSEKLTKLGKSLERARDNAAKIQAQAKELDNLKGQKAQELRKRLRDRLGKKSPKNINSKKIVSMLTDEEKAIFNEMNAYKREAQAVQKELAVANKSVRSLKGPVRATARRVERALLRAKSIGRKLESKFAKKLAGVLLKKAAGQILKILSGVGWILTAIDIAAFLGPILWNFFSGNWGGTGGGDGGKSDGTGDGELVDDSTPTTDEVQGAAGQGQAGQGEPGQGTRTPTGQQGTSDVPTGASTEKQEGQKVTDPDEEKGGGKGAIPKAGPQGEGEEGEASEDPAVEGHGTKGSASQGKDQKVKDAPSPAGEGTKEKEPGSPKGTAGKEQETENKDANKKTDASGEAAGDGQNEKSSDGKDVSGTPQGGGGNSSNNPLPTLKAFKFQIMAGYSPDNKYTKGQEIKNFQIKFSDSKSKTHTPIFTVVVDQPPTRVKNKGTTVITARLINKNEWKISDVLYMPAGAPIEIVTTKKN